MPRRFRPRNILPRFLQLGALVPALAVLSGPTRSPAADATAEQTDARLLETVKYLASDELEGRGPGTNGINLAADFLAKQFAQLGLKTANYDGTPFQKFKMTTSAKIGPTNALELVGPTGASGAPPERITLKLHEDFNPLAIGGTQKFNAPLVFVGYGITGKDEHYDDYAGLDVKGKVVVVLRHEPQQANPHSAFNGTEHSPHAPFVRKVSNAYEHGAAAIIFCNDQFDIQKTITEKRRAWQAAVDKLAENNAAFKAIEKPSTDQLRKHEEEADKLVDEIKSLVDQVRAAADPVLGFEGAGPDGEGRSFAVIFARRAPLDKAIKAALGIDLAALEAAIDKEPSPQSRELKGWAAVGETSVDRQETEVKNVVAVLEGEGPHADETIVIGAHYDHLGYGDSSSLAPGVKEIHNGADDNGSGAATLVEVARDLATRPKKLARRIVFIAFTGEERGLLGSTRYVREPLVPLDKTVAMLNMDMVGRLKDEKLIVHGTGTADVLDPLVDRLGKQFGFAITKKPGGFGPSDHSSFYAKHIPVLHLFTGSHSDYHRPSDDYDKLNVDGMRRVGQMVTQMAIELADAPEPPKYVESKDPAPAGGKGGDRPYFGSIPDFSQDQPGYALTGVTKDGPAEKAGLKAGDIIVQLGESKIGNLEDFDSALRKFKAGDKVPVIAQRGKENVTVEVTLAPPR